MGIINVTPDSFSDGGKYFSTNGAIAHGIRLVSEGADILDIGGESSRPGSEPINPQQQIDRVCPVIEKLRADTDITISVDTTSSLVASEAISNGAVIINDISALRFDEKMVEIAAHNNTGLILMHMKGTPRNMQDNPRYDNVVDEVYGFLEKRIVFAEEHGVNPSNIVIDPGIGFGKNLEGNLELLNSIDDFRKLGKPVLIGASGKSFIGSITGRDVANRLAGSLAVATYCALNGVDIIRVHDVEETSDVLKLLSALGENLKND